MSTLENWGRVIQTLGDSEFKRQQEEIEGLEKLLAEFPEKLKTVTDQEALDALMAFSVPVSLIRKRQLFKQLQDLAAREVLRRMGKETS